jgi:hypothetical protein
LKTGRKRKVRVLVRKSGELAAGLSAAAKEGVLSPIIKNRIKSRMTAAALTCSNPSRREENRFCSRENTGKERKRNKSN